jgi:hypothetical protein
MFNRARKSVLVGLVISLLLVACPPAEEPTATMEPTPEAALGTEERPIQVYFAVGRDRPDRRRG